MKGENSLEDIIEESLGLSREGSKVEKSAPKSSSNYDS